MSSPDLYRARSAAGQALARDAEDDHPGIAAFATQDVDVLCESHEISFPISGRGDHAANWHSAANPCHWQVWTRRNWDDPPATRLY